MDLYWHKQTPGQPLFADLLWSRPENRANAGKLLVIGGNAYEFAAPAEAFTAAQKAGIGVARVLLPDRLHKTIGHSFEAGEYTPSTPSGSFSQKSLNDFLATSAWADGTFLAGDLGRNSETAILLEKFSQKYDGPLIVTKDAADYFTNHPQNLLQRTNTTLIVSFAQLQKLAVHAHFNQAFTFGMSLLSLVNALHDFTLTYPVQVIVKHLENIFVATNGKVSSTKITTDMPTWRVRTAAYAAVWLIQNPSRQFDALTTAIYEAII